MSPWPGWVTACSNMSTRSHLFWSSFDHNIFPGLVPSTTWPFFMPTSLCSCLQPSYSRPRPPSSPLPLTPIVNCREKDQAVLAKRASWRKPQASCWGTPDVLVEQTGAPTLPGWGITSCSLEPHSVWGNTCVLVKLSSLLPRLCIYANVKFLSSYFQWSFRENMNYIFFIVWDLLNLCFCVILSWRSEAKSEQDPWLQQQTLIAGGKLRGICFLE